MSQPGSIALPAQVIKVCGVTTEADARHAVDCGANSVGYNFYPRSPRFVEPQPWMASIPALKVGIFVNEAPERVEQTAEAAGLDVVQIYGEDAPRHWRVWRAVRPGETLRPADAYVYDVSEGSGRTFDWSLAAGKDHPVVLAGGLDGGNVAEAIRVARPWGVDACSRLESAPGRKDLAKVRDFVQAAAAAFSTTGGSR